MFLFSGFNDEPPVPNDSRHSDVPPVPKGAWEGGREVAGQILENAGGGAARTDHSDGPAQPGEPRVNPRAYAAWLLYSGTAFLLFVSSCGLDYWSLRCVRLLLRELCFVCWLVYSGSVIINNACL